MTHNAYQEYMFKDIVATVQLLPVTP
jgi:hypothetical protein